MEHVKAIAIVTFFAFFLLLLMMMITICFSVSTHIHT